MSTKTTTKVSSSKKRRTHRRRGSGHSNASIISIDHVSLKRLRKYQDKVAKEKKMQKKKFAEHKKKQQSLRLENAKKFEKYIDSTKELKEEGDDDDGGGADDEYLSYDDDAGYNVNKPSSSSIMGKNNGYDMQSQQQMDEITVEELLPLIKNLVEKHNNLQQEYDDLNRQLHEQKIIMEDKIIKLEQENNHYRNGQNSLFNEYHIYEEDEMDPDQNNLNNQQHPTKQEQAINEMKNRYENDIISIESKYAQEIDSYKIEMKNLKKELSENYAEINALRQSLEAADHENEQLTMTINNNNKQFQNIKLIQNKNKQFLAENDELKQTVIELQQEMEYLYEQKQNIQQQLQLIQQQQPRVQTPKSQSNEIQIASPQKHTYTKTIMASSTNVNVTDNESNHSNNDLLHQLEDYQYNSNNDTIDDRDSLDENYDDEKQQNDENENTLDNLSKYKDIDQTMPSSAQQIMALLESKDIKRSRGLGTQPSQEMIDNFSVESNYSDSEQKLEEQIDAIEDDIRELKDMVLSIMDSTNNITPTINSNLGPLIRKINRMYVMLSGGLLQQSRTSHIDDNGSGARSVLPHRQRFGSSIIDGGGDTETEADTESSNISPVHNHKNEWFWLRPYINDWMPSIGFSAIILSTMYLLIKYHKGKFMFGQPRVLRKR